MTGARREEISGLTPDDIIDVNIPCILIVDTAQRLILPIHSRLRSFHPSLPMNTLVVGPGNYPLIGFLRIGTPFSLLALGVSVTLVPWALPF
ncbi:hypothetical protein [Phaeovulum sp.]|uniref:hypothetical protein n=1 Tax=Phaeovulum sp. TaxID=2934796 RepID=UPI0039E2729E